MGLLRDAGKKTLSGYQMEKKTPLQKIEQWIINNQTNSFYQEEASEALILYVEKTCNLYKFG